MKYFVTVTASYFLACLAKVLSFDNEKPVSTARFKAVVISGSKYLVSNVSTVPIPLAPGRTTAKLIFGPTAKIGSFRTAIPKATCKVNSQQPAQPHGVCFIVDAV